MSYSAVTDFGIEFKDEKMASAKEYFRERQQNMYSKEYREGIRRHRRKVWMVVGISVLVIMIACISIYYYNVNRVYSGYDVTKEFIKDDNEGAGYVLLQGKLIRYGMDGISCYDENYEALWNQSYEMKSPMVDVCGSYIAVCDTNGTKFYVLGEEGLKGEVETQLPIKRIEVADQGVVAVLMEDGDVNRINYYDRTGTLLAENKAPIEKSGFPMDISLSNDGMKMAVSYMVLESGSIKTKVAFYNFDTVGANEIDHLVSAKEYDKAVIPKIEFVNVTTAVAFGDEFFDIFQGSQKPVAQVQKKFKEKILSVCYTDSHIGFVLEHSGDKPYMLKVYDLQGKEELSLPFALSCKEVKIKNQMVYLISDTQCHIYNFQGKLKFQGKFNEGLVDVLPLEENRMIAVQNKTIQTIRLK